MKGKLILQQVTTSGGKEEVLVEPTIQCRATDHGLT